MYSFHRRQLLSSLSNRFVRNFISTSTFVQHAKKSEKEINDTRNPNLVYVPGPGGTMELKLGLSSVPQTNSEEYVPNTQTCQIDPAVTASSSKSHSYASLKPSKPAGGDFTNAKSVTQSIESRFRYDMCNLDHRTLYRQVLHAKQRIRTFGKNQTDFKMTSLPVKKSKKDKPDKLFVLKRTDKKLFRRTVNRLLSSQYLSLD